MNTARRKVLVTGAGTGMGLEAARRFAAGGAQTILVARNAERLRQVSAELNDSIVFACDISETTELSRLVAYIRSDHDDLDTVLLNAGVTHTYRFFDPDEDAVDHAAVEMRTNYLSAVSLIRSLVPVLDGQADAALIVTTSGAAFAPDITNPTYSATKAALHSLTQAVRLQLERDGSDTKVFEFMAPLVDSAFSAGVSSDQKMSVGDAVDGLFEGLARDELELRVGASRLVYEALRTSSDAAVRAVNATTNG